MRADITISVETLGFILVIFSVIISTNAQYDDTRCKCVCPDPQIVTKNVSQTNRKLYIGRGPTCDCVDVVLPKVEKEIEGKESEFCSRCECKYESRNTTIIKVVVILVIGIVSLLMTYMLFLMCLDPLLNKRIKTSASYQEHTNEDDESVVSGGGRTTTHMRNLSGTSVTSQGPGSTSSSSVLNRVTGQQNKWKRQVQEQRRNIYNLHTMLN